MGRRLLMCMIVVSAVACGAPTVQQAARRVPADGARESFGRPYPEVYAAVQRVIAQAIKTPDWKELRVVHDDPDGGVLIAERRLEGIIPGLRVRDLWSFYFTREGPDLTTVTFVLDSSDWPAAGAGVRSWTKARSEIFPAMAEMLGPPVAVRPVGTASSGSGFTGHEAPAVAGGAPSPARAPAPPAGAEQAERGAATERPPGALTLGRLQAALEASEEWRRSTRRRTIGGDDLVTVGDWAQLSVRGERVEVAFPTYPAPPAYDVARLMRFLSEAGFSLDVLPGTAFRAP